MYKYDPKSEKADEFINHEEILDTLEYARQHKSDRELIEKIIDKADIYINFRKYGLKHEDNGQDAYKAKTEINYFERSEKDGKNTGDKIIYASV